MITVNRERKPTFERPVSRALPPLERLLFRYNGLPQMTLCSVCQAKLAKDKEVKVLYGERSSQPLRPRVMRGCS